jgi:hypothetical protein
MAKHKFWQGLINGKSQIIMKHQYWQSANYSKILIMAKN